MSIVKPHKLGIIAGPGSDFFAGRVFRHLRRLYLERYQKLSAALVKRHDMSPEELLDVVTLNDDLISKRIPRGKKPKTYTCPNFEIPVKYTRFANGEVKAEILQAVRGLRIFIIYDMANQYPIKVAGSDEPIPLSVNDHIMFLFTTINALMTSGVDGITLVLPTYPYARQHKKSGREALTAALFGRMIENMGVERIITLDIHSREIENCFNLAHMENVHASYQILIKLHKIIDFNDPDLVVVSPDTGAVQRNRFYAEALHRPLAMLYKERDYSVVSKDAKNSNIRSISLLGDVKGKTVIMADDMIGTGGTLLLAMKELKALGAKKIICLASLPFFNGNAREQFDQAYKEGIFYRIVGTNAVFHDRSLTDKEWFLQADVTELFARVISRLHHGRALSPLLDNRQFIHRLIDMSQANPQAPLPGSREVTKK
jgi:ribose-phosphate pyrophosphokinase